ncbi:MAG: alpha/beta fold hydrolase [Rhodocyclaceae bacterium]|nr:alpha/beta fold hydrolase [Rhodocyclaceae bacterium]
MSAAPYALSVVGLSAVGGLAFRHFVRRGLAPAQLHEQRCPADVGLGYEEVTIPTANGKHLFAWFVPAAAAGKAPAAIALHGWGGNAETMLPLLKPLHAAGFAVVLFDARCHGRSDLDDFTSLPRFAEDCHHVMNWLQRHPAVEPSRIALIGHSVGAAAALLVSARRDDVAAVVSLAAFAHPATMMRRYLAARHIPYRPLGWLVLGYVQRVIGHRFDAIAPLTVIAKVRCPTLLVHGTADATVPVAEAQAIFDARAGDHVKLKIVSGSHDDFGDERDVAGEIADLVAFLQAAPKSA